MNDGLESMITALFGNVAMFVLVGVVLVFVIKSVRIVPQQSVHVVERLGRYNESLEAGLHWLVPFIDRVAYIHELKEVPLDIEPQVCITQDNTQVKIDGVIYYQVTDAKLASYGSSNYVLAIAQLAQTSLRSEVGKRALDKLLEDRDAINIAVVSALDKASTTWGVKVLRYEIKDILPPEPVLRSMQLQITAEREKRAKIAESEGERQKEINLAEGEKQAAIMKSEGEMQAAINKAEGDARAIRVVAEATAEAIAKVAEAINKPGGEAAINLKVAEQYVQAFGNVAKQTNTLILPANLGDVGSLVASAMTVVKAVRKED